MGQKVHPTGIRLGIVKDHTSVWYAEGRDYADKLNNDLQVRRFLQERLKNASLSHVQIERPANNARITIHTARPGIVIGKKGEDVDRLRRDLTQMMGVPVHVNIEEVRKPELDAQLVAQNIAGQLERRVMFRRAMKRSVQNAMRLGAKGIKVQLSGRLGGAEIARTEWYREGRVPLHTLRADIDYATYEAHTTYGVIGVKVWVFKGEILGGIEEVRAKQKQPQPASAPKKKGSK
ncbi:30S ribosomal protein S3 [Phytohalomonas tamaricis]|uniref:30S ribosomal protein S3 n=1 Tax=Phytohalomonas tamaricis TaxID=2081032 RepID=UPI000D0B26E4|nr:30S ribosomal protein S3 [Phytohalomonas tamaricis]